MANIQELFSKHFEGSINVNKAIIKQYGTDAAVLLGELISKQKYWHERDELESGFYYWSMKDIREATGLGRRPQERIIPVLEKAGMITVKRQPRHPLWFKVNIGQVMDKIAYVQNGHSTMSETDTGLCPNRTTTNPITNPITKSTATDNLDIKGTDPNLKAVISFYYELLEKYTGDTPIQQWAKDSSIIKKAADGQIMAQGADKVKHKLKAWFLSADGYTRSSGFPLGLFVKQYNNIKVGSKYPEHDRIDHLPLCVDDCKKCAAVIWEGDKRCRDCGEPVPVKRVIDT